MPNSNAVLSGPLLGSWHHEPKWNRQYYTFVDPVQLIVNAVQQAHYLQKHIESVTISRYQNSEIPYV